MTEQRVASSRNVVCGAFLPYDKGGGMELSVVVISSENLALPALATDFNQSFQYIRVLPVHRALTFECLLLNRKEGFRRNTRLDRDAVMLFRLDEVTADVLTHPAQKPVGLADVFQQVGVACRLCVALPVEW